MIGRRFISFLKRNPSPASSQSLSSAKFVEEEGKTKTWGRRIFSGSLICLTGGVALSALDDLAIYGGCSSAAMEKASQNQAVIDAIGEPIVRGPWYNASLAVTHNRQSVSCSFPISGPKGTGILRLKAVGGPDVSWHSFFRRRGWEILIMEALIHVPTNEDKQQTFRINISDILSDNSASACTDCRPPQPKAATAKRWKGYFRTERVFFILVG